MALQKTVTINTLQAQDAYFKITSRTPSEFKEVSGDKVVKKFQVQVRVSAFKDKTCKVALGHADGMQMTYTFVSGQDEPTLDALYLKLKLHKDFEDAIDC